MLDSFEQLGQAVQRKWRATHFDDRAFVEIAREELARTPQKPDAWMELIRDFGHASFLPTQQLPDSDFGSPPLTAFTTDRFFIEVLFWLEGETAVHQHGFAGAFGLICGSSIHCRYEFEARDRVHSGLRLGLLELTSAELLGPGDVRTIESGGRFIHSTFHLEKPTVTVVVRTIVDPEASPQLTYLRPSVALASGAPPVQTARRLKALEYLLLVRPTEYVSLVSELVERADFELALRVVRQADQHLHGSHVIRSMLETLEKRFGERARALEPMLDEAHAATLIHAARAQAADKDLRFLLGLLLNVPSRKQLVRLLAERLSEDSVRKLVERHGTSLVAGLAASEAEGHSLQAALADLLLSRPVEPAIAVRLREAPLLRSLFHE